LADNPGYGEMGGTDAEFFDRYGTLRGRKGSFYEGGSKKCASPGGGGVFTEFRHLAAKYR
jgi:hypothetical protein